MRWREKGKKGGGEGARRGEKGGKQSTKKLPQVLTFSWDTPVSKDTGISIARNTNRKQNNSQKFSLRKPQKDFSSQVVQAATRWDCSKLPCLPQVFFGLWGNPWIKGKLVVCEAIVE